MIGQDPERGPGTARPGSRVGQINDVADSLRHCAKRPDKIPV